MARNIKLLFVFLCLSLVFYAGFMVMRQNGINKQTGILVVSAKPSSALLAVSADNKSAATLGIGSARARLDPGTYLVTATDNGSTVYVMATVLLGKTSSVSLDTSKADRLPSPDNINFTGLDTLINNGMTSDQVNNLRVKYFMFNQKTKVVTIDQNSVTPGARDANSADSFRLIFNTNIDGKSYGATVVFGVGSATELVLYNEVGVVVYDSGPPISQKYLGT